jgi:phage shock protein A
MLTTPVIETHLNAFHEVIAECTDLKSRVETERMAVSAVTAAIVNASETLARRGYMTPQKVEGLTLSIEENALDLKAALDEVDASIRTAIGPVEKFAAVTERLRTAQRRVLPVHVTAALGQSEGLDALMVDSMAAQHSALCEHLLESVRELASKATHRLDDLREKIDRLQSSYGEITAAMAS